MKLGKAARDYDNAPFMAVINGAPISFNDPNNPMLTSKVVWSGALTAVIGEEDLVKTDVNQKKDKEIAKLQLWYQMTQSPEALIKLGEAMGIKNPESDVQAMQQQQAMQAQSQAMGVA